MAQSLDAAGFLTKMTGGCLEGTYTCITKWLSNIIEPSGHFKQFLDNLFHQSDNVRRSIT